MLLVLQGLVDPIRVKSPLALLWTVEHSREKICKADRIQES